MQKAEGDEDRGNEENERTQDPHDDGSCALVSDWIDMEGIGALEVVGVDGAVAEGQEGGEGRVDDVCEDQVGKHDPAGVAGCGGPWADERPPEEDRCCE